MAIENTTVRTDVYVGDGSNKTFAFDFRIEEANDLKVYVKNAPGDYVLQTLDTDYTLSLTYNTDGSIITGGTITYPKTGNALPSTGRIYAIRKTDDTQELSSDSISFQSKDIEQGLDKITMRLQEVTEDLDKCLKTENMSDDVKSMFASLGMPSNIYTELTLGASGATYTAPANGYFCLNKRTGGSGYIWCSIIVKDSSNNTVICLEEGKYLDDSGNLTFLVPVLKDQVITISYNATGDTELFNFIYAEGSKQEAE